VPSETLRPDFSGSGGLIPAIAQDAVTGEVLMLAWMSAESYAETVATGRAVYYSRSRKRLWRKGEESGLVQVGDAACHEGYKSCFFREVTPEGVQVIAPRVFDPQTVYQPD
jgi:phosphoribosyl-AMP cyclohydrolase